MELLFSQINFPNSFFGFGHPRKFGSFKSWILQFKDAHGTKELWGANRWIHICLAYEKSTGFVKVVRVSSDTHAYHMLHVTCNMKDIRLSCLMT